MLTVPAVGGIWGYDGRCQPPSCRLSPSPSVASVRSRARTMHATRAVLALRAIDFGRTPQCGVRLEAFENTAQAWRLPPHYSSVKDNIPNNQVSDIGIVFEIVQCVISVSAAPKGI